MKAAATGQGEDVHRLAIALCRAVTSMPEMVALTAIALVDGGPLATTRAIEPAESVLRSMVMPDERASA